MKPISVAFQCFGPYMERQEIDFTKLEDSRLFLICGETGSGKTTILEAMSYALYDQSSGGTRGDLSAMRYEKAPANMETYVEFVFDSGGQRYRFYRSILPKKKRKPTEGKKTLSDFNASYECNRIIDGQRVPILDFKGRKTDVHKLAEDIIGLKHEQFCQVVILPQGKFETFLVSNSSEKEKILVSLFRLGQWQRATDWIKGKAEAAVSAAAEEKRRIEEALGSYGCQTIEELAQKLETTVETVEEARQKAETAKKLFDQRKKIWDETLLANKDFEERNKAKETLDQLLLTKGEKEKEEQTLARAEKAERIKEAYQAYERAKENRKAAAQTVTATDMALEAAQEEIIRVTKKQEEHNNRRETMEGQRQTLQLYGNAASVYASLEEKKIAAAKGESDYKTAESLAHKAQKALDQGKSALLKAKEAQMAAYEAKENAQNGYMQGIGFILAQELMEGEPCPVCGSCHHPHMAVATESHVTKEQLEEKKKAFRDAQAWEDRCTNRLEGLDQENRLAQNKLTEEQQKNRTAQEEYLRAKEQCIPGIDNEKALKAAIKELEKDISAYETEEKGLIEEKVRAEEGLKRAERDCASAQVAMKEANSQLEQAESHWTRKLQEAGFSTEREYIEARMDPEEKIERHKSLHQYYADLDRARQDWEKRTKELEGRQVPDIDAIRLAREEGEKEYTERNSTYEKLKEEPQKINADLDRLTRCEKDYQEKTEKAQAMKAFADRLRGSSDISLQRFVLGVMLSAITQEANRILEKVYDGRYRLYRTDEASGREHKKGLELGVYSDGNPEGRSVRSLSGGEKFLVSLCLAIGLSTVVQSRGKGARIEALFVDEGFGALDRARIRDAMEVLHYIRDTSGLVGIISHVESLAESIPTKLQIKKGKNGSKCELCL